VPLSPPTAVAVAAARRRQRMKRETGAVAMAPRGKRDVGSPQAPSEFALVCTMMMKREDRAHTSGEGETACS
jgi:hypothetical protein